MPVHIRVEVKTATWLHVGALEPDNHLERGLQAWECQHDIGTHSEEATANPGLDDEYQTTIQVCNDPDCDEQVEVE